MICTISGIRPRPTCGLLHVITQLANPGAFKVVFGPQVLLARLFFVCRCNQTPHHRPIRQDLLDDRDYNFVVVVWNALPAAVAMTWSRVQAGRVVIV